MAAQMYNQHQAIPANLAQMQFQAFIPGYQQSGIPYPGPMPLGLNQPRFDNSKVIFRFTENTKLRPNLRDGICSILRVLS